MIFEVGGILRSQPLEASCMALTDTEIRRSKPGLYNKQPQDPTTL